MHQYKPGLPLFKNSTMALKVGKQFVSIQVRSKKFYKGVLYKSSLHLEREIEEKRERKRSRKFKLDYITAHFSQPRNALFLLVNK